MKRRLGLAANAVATACVVVALLKHQTEDAVVFGALDADADAVAQPNIVPWLVAALVLIVAGTALLALQRD